MRRVFYVLVLSLLGINAPIPAETSDTNKDPERLKPPSAQEIYAAYWTMEPGWHTEIELRNNALWRERSGPVFLERTPTSGPP